MLGGARSSKKQVHADDLVEYLPRFGFDAIDEDLWVSIDGIPQMTLQVTRHEKIGGATCYEIVVELRRIGKAELVIKWRSWQCLAILRVEIHDPVTMDMGTEYTKYFKDTPFASRFGFAGTTARLNAWCRSYVAVASLGLLRPRTIANALCALEAPLARARKSAGTHEKEFGIGVEIDTRSESEESELADSDDCVEDCIDA